MNVLDQGGIKIIEVWGKDESIIEAARMSTGKGFQGWETDAKLLEFLWKNKHHTPFEMAGAVIEVKAPLFVFREWHRHRTQSYNEMSARYIPLPDENYAPLPAEIVRRSELGAGTKNRQASGTRVTTQAEAEEWVQALHGLYLAAEELYQQGIELGVPKELARLPVPVARYSRMRASANLRNWLQFLTLRAASNAQWEIQQYAYALKELLSGYFPRTIQLFEDFK